MSTPVVIIVHDRGRGKRCPMFMDDAWLSKMVSSYALGITTAHPIRPCNCGCYTAEEGRPNDPAQMRSAWILYSEWIKGQESGWEVEPWPSLK